MSRAFATDVLEDRAGNKWQNALGTLYTDEAATVLATDAYAAASGGSPVTTVTTDSAGRWKAWFTTPKSFWIKWSDNGDTAYPAGSPSQAQSFTTFVSAQHDAFEPPSVEVADDVFNVKHATYGAVGDGVANDTAAIQAAIDAAVAAGGGVVYLPAGTYKVTARLYFTNFRGLTIRGAGMYFTSIAAAGTFTSLIEGEGVAYCKFEDFQLTVTSGTITNMLYVHQGAGSIGCTRNTYRNIHIGNGGTGWINGFAMGTDGTTACDSQNFYSCFISGNWSTGGTSVYQYAFKFGNGSAGNVLANFMYGCAVYNVRYPSYWGGSSGGWIGGQISGSETNLGAVVNRNVVLQGLRIELSERIWQLGSGAGSGAIAAVALRDLDYNAANLNADTYCVDHRIGGSLTLSNVNVVGAGVGVDPKVNVATQASSTLTVTVAGLAMQSAVTSAFVGSSTCHLIINAYTELSDTPDGDVVTTIGESVDFTTNAASLLWPEGRNIALGTSTGTKIGTATSQKLGFFNATPVVQQTGASDVLASLVNLGLRAASSNPPLNLGTGALTAGATQVSGLGVGVSPSVTVEANGIVRSDRSGTPSQYVQLNGGDTGGLYILANSANKNLLIQNLTPNGTAATSANLIAFAIGQTGVDVTTPLTIAYNSGNGLITLAGSVDIAVGTSTGTKIGTSTSQKLGFFNATPVVQPGALTQTYSTADATLSAYTSDPESVAYTGIDNAQPSTPYAQVTDLNALRTAYETLRVFTEDLAAFTNSLVDKLQSLGLVG